MSSIYTYKSFAGSSHRLVGELVDSLSPKTILDVACDAGFLTKSLKRKTSIYGIDLKTYAQMSGYMRIWHMNLNHTNFRFLSPKNYDVVVLADILEHLTYPHQVLNRLRKHGSSFIICLPNMNFFPVLICLKLGIRPQMSTGPFDVTHLHDFNLQTASHFIKFAKFDIIKTIPVPPPMSLFHLSFLQNASWWFADLFPNLFAYQIIFLAKPK